MVTTTLKVGDTVVIDNVEFIVNRFNVTRDKDTGVEVRAQIDLMALDEIKRRRNNLNDLLFLAGAD